MTTSQLSQQTRSPRTGRHLRRRRSSSRTSTSNIWPSPRPSGARVVQILTFSQPSRRRRSRTRRLPMQLRRSTSTTKVLPTQSLLKSRQGALPRAHRLKHHPRLLHPNSEEAQEHEGSRTGMCLYGDHHSMSCMKTTIVRPRSDQRVIKMRQHQRPGLFMSQEVGTNAPCCRHQGSSRRTSVPKSDTVASGGALTGE